MSLLLATLTLVLTALAFGFCCGMVTLAWMSGMHKDLPDADPNANANVDAEPDSEPDASK